MPRYWILVATHSRVQEACAGGFIELGRGRWAGYLQRMSPGDLVVYYSPSLGAQEGQPCQRFTALGEVLEGDIRRVSLREGFSPHRREVRFEVCREVDARELLDKLSFIRNPRAWGARFRRACFEIGAEDYQVIRDAMVADVGIKKREQP